jgi:cation diffusion facilitator CzcD-associated flavoprotein CzcO
VEVTSKHYDAVVIGAGFGGVYMMHKLKNELGLNVLGLEKAPDVGGAWWWNRYPGARSDTWSHLYRFSHHAFPPEIAEAAPLSEWYWNGAEIQEYIRWIADAVKVSESYRFNVTATSAAFDDVRQIWVIKTADGAEYTAKYCIPAVGRLTEPYVPDINGLPSFEGQVFHSSRWPEDADLRGKRVGVLGTGSTGIQLLVAIAPEVGHLTVFQRSPQYVVPARNRAFTSEERRRIRDEYPSLWNRARESRHLGAVAGFPERDIKTSDISLEEARDAYQRAWEDGNGLAFTATFTDFGIDESANEVATDFVREKLDSVVTDPETRRKLTPHGPWSRRPICVDNYYETFNRDNVSIVSLAETPITRVVANGIETSDKKVHVLDILVLATGYDAGEGAMRHLNIVGRDGVRLNDRWDEELPTSYLGSTISGFPNLLFVFGPLGAPSLNNVAGLEAMVEQVTDLIKEVERRAAATVEVRPEAEQRWLERCVEVVEGTLAYNDPGNWFFGGNVPGKRFGVRGYYGRIVDFREAGIAERDAGYPAYAFSGDEAPHPT